jgi:hypothetical protein
VVQAGGVHRGHTFLDGLLNAKSAISNKIWLVSASCGVVDEDRPFSLFLSNEESGSSLMGLDGSGASLLGCGVSAEVSPGRVNDLLERTEIGVFFAGVAVDEPGLGVLVGLFWKKPRMDFWFLVDCEPEGGCFF